MAASLVAVPLRYTLLRALGHALVVDDPINQNAEIIVLPEWAGGAGTLEAADLVRRDVARRVVILGEPGTVADLELARRRGRAFRSNADSMAQILGELGVKTIDRLTDDADGTEAEGRVLSLFCREQDIKSVIVVSEPDHSRRIARVLRRSMQAAGTSSTVTIRSTRYSSFNPDGWWRTRAGTRTEIQELEKLVLDVARHPVS